MTVETPEAAPQANTETVAEETVVDTPAEGNVQTPAEGEVKPVMGDNVTETKETSEPASEQQTDEKGKDTQSPTPEKYELKLPEGSQLTETQVADVEAAAKELGLSNEQAQKLVDRNSKLLQDHLSATETAWAEEQASWADEVRADPEMGGQKLEQTKEQANAALARFGTPTLVEQLKETGFNNHPEILRVFSRIGASMSEGGHVAGANAGAGTKSAADVMYPKTHLPT